MTCLRAAVAVEGVKAAASRVIQSVTILVVAGVAVLAGSLTWAAKSGNDQVVTQLGPLAHVEGWNRFLGVAAQITAAGVLLGFGVALSWMVGREFTDGTITGLVALPVSRPAIAAAKFVVYLLWALVTATVLTGVLALIGLALDLGPFDAPARAGLVRQFGLTVITAGLAVPAAWASTLGRNLLPGVAVAVGIVVLAQVAVVAGAGAWLPFAAPALWTLEPSHVSRIQLGLVGTIPLVFGWATLFGWHRLELDR
jgi:ABC-2 type transport system permease protein